MKFLNNKKILIPLAGLIIIAIVMVAIMSRGGDNPIDDKVQDVIQEVQENIEELNRKAMYEAITQNVKIGQSKKYIIETFSPNKKEIGDNYVISPNYTRIGENDYLTTFIFNNDILVAVLHERILDGTEKHNLAVEFQKFASKIGELYTLVDIREDWFSAQLNYNSTVWNDAILKNNLELYADFENSSTEEFIQVVASGINYFDFLAYDRENLSMGNLNLIYTVSTYKDDFMSFVSLAVEQK